MIYVAHKYGGKFWNIIRAWIITRKLALANPNETYVCPLLAFMYLRYGELGKKNDMRICTDMLGECKRMVIASKVSSGIQEEIDFCNEWEIPIEFYKQKVETIWQRIYHKLFPI